MAEPVKRPSTRERRISSAKARLTPDSSLLAAAERTYIVKEAQERAKSAKNIKEKHKASGKMFPKASGKGRFTTMYSTDYDGTFVPPAEPRPTSPTRRNNPHPGKQFMVWRIPTREIGGTPFEEGLELPPEYITRNEDFDAIDELSGNLGGLQLPPPRQTSQEYGAYLRKQRLEQQYQEQLRPRVKPITNDVLLRTVAGGNQAALQDWLQVASPDERHTVLKMLKSAEEAQVKDTINTVMQPTAAKAVQGWLQSADDKERDVAVRLFSSLGQRQGGGGVRGRTYSEPGTPNGRPPSRRPIPPIGPPSQTNYGPGGEKLRTRRLSAPPGARPKQQPAGVWHHKAIRDPPPQVYHRGALFGATRGDASHFTVHPEWPDYFGPSDAVH